MSARDEHRYDALFFRYIEEGAVRSARIVVPTVVECLGVRSVLDVGCGAGAWLGEYLRAGVEALGIDGEYVDRERLLVPADRFVELDVSRPFDLGRRFDLVQCLEVGEHLPHDASSTLVGNLTRHSDRILFSAAIPGQGGEHHVNEQSYEFWRGLFAERGFSPFDFIRPRLAGSRVEPWYARNMILYAAAEATEHLRDEVRRTRVPEGFAIPDLSPLSFRVRRSILRRLPVGVVTRLAILKHRVATRTRPGRS